MHPCSKSLHFHNFYIPIIWNFKKVPKTVFHISKTLQKEWSNLTTIWLTKIHIKKDERMAVWRRKIWKAQNSQPRPTNDVYAKGCFLKAGYALSQKFNFSELTLQL